MSAADPSAELAPTGTLRASINLGNPVLAHGTADDPGGVTVELARALAGCLGVPLELQCFSAARDSFAAVTEGRADIGFFAVEPAREAQVAFSAPYTSIKGVFVVAHDAPPRTPADVDRAGVRIGVKEGSAYDLFLTRTVQHASLVRGDEGVDVFLGEQLEVGAGIRQPVQAWVLEHPGHRIIEPAFMQIHQAVAVPRDRSAAVVARLDAFVTEQVDSGLVEQALRRTAATHAGD